MAISTGERATEAELREQPRDGRKYELVDGEIRVSPAGARHGKIALKLGARLLSYVEEHGLGHVLDSSTGFRLPGGNVRSPDVAVVTTGRFESEQVPEGFSPVPPDLAVEILSADDRQRDVLDKIGEYLDAGVRLVWVVDPASGTASAYRSLNDVRALDRDDALEGEDVIPGFTCPLRDVLG